jgi:hypothetical protein
VNLQQLVDTIEIQRLKARYFRFLDHRQWNELRDLFVENLEFFVENSIVPQSTTPTFKDADSFLSNLRATDPARVAIHHGHMPDIEFLDDDHAKGIWAVFYWVDDPGRKVAFQEYGYYYEDYLRCSDGCWRIASVRLTRLRTNEVPSQV